MSGSARAADQAEYKLAAKLNTNRPAAGAVPLKTLILYAGAFGLPLHDWDCLPKVSGIGRKPTATLLHARRPLARFRSNDAADRRATRDITL